jgi:hypothetical protein
MMTLHRCGSRALAVREDLKVDGLFYNAVWDQDVVQSVANFCRKLEKLETV